MSQRRWLVITSSFPRHERDFAGQFVEYWCRSLIERGHHIDVYCWRGQGARERRLGPGSTVRFVPYAWRGAERLFFGAGAPENLASAPHRALLAGPAAVAMIGAVFRALQRRRYDGIVGHWLVPGGAIARIVGAVAQLPVRIVGHSGGIHLLATLGTGLARACARWLCDVPTTVPTAALRDDLVKLSGCDDVCVAPMGFAPAPQLGADDARESMHRRGDMVVGFLGRLVPIKGLSTVIRAVEVLRRQGNKVKLEVVGHGPCRRRWKALAGPGVRFVGAKYGDEKWAHLRRWDGLVMPSKIGSDGRHEGLPVSLLEGASVGAIPLVSGIPGVESWLVRPNRQIVEEGSIDGWCRALRWLASLDGGRQRRLQHDTRQMVSKLAWPEYGTWWDKWLGSG